VFKEESMKYLSIIILVLLVQSCAKSGYKTFYTSYADAKTLPDVELLQEGEEAKIYGSDNVQRDSLILRSKKYIPVGYSSFNGGYEDTKNAGTQAKLVGATVVLVSSKYTNTQTTTSTLLLPDNKTTYHSGTANANTTYSSNGSYLGSSNTNALYNGTSTTYGTKAVPITTNQLRYDQGAMYFVKSNQKYKFGVQFSDLTPEQRNLLERNTGAQVKVVIEDSPSFYSNVLAGDFLIAVDGQLIKNTEHGVKLMGSVPSEANYSTLTVIRNGTKKDIKVQF
jgi:serine protease Do